MSISAKQQAIIDQIYNDRRLNNRIEHENRMAEVYEKSSDIEDIDSQISTLAGAAMRKALNGDTLAKDKLKDDLDKLNEKKKSLLLANGFDADYLDDIFTCEECLDTGFVDNKPCACRQKEIIKLLYSRSELKELLERENFETFDETLYSDSFVDEQTGTTSFKNIKDIKDYCENFASNFDNEFDSIFLYGPAGTGKTFIINCMAKRLLDTFHSVIYLSASQFFDLMADQAFRQSNNSVYSNITLDDLRHCDLLIIDDLGSEFTNSFTDASLFDILNERLIHQKSTIISTNLSLEDFKNRYDERIFSRIVGNYSIFKIFGDDIRKLKKLS